MSEQTQPKPNDQAHDHQAAGDQAYADILIEGHDYDGIKEYDNPMPGWWLWIFFITIVWSLFYVVGISMGFVNTYQDDLRQAQRSHEQVRQAHAMAAPTVDEAMIASRLGNDDVLTRGKQAYMGSCAACHGNAGEGGIGPNLADDHWLYGGDLVSIYAAIYDGIPAKGMPAWGPILTQDDIIATVVFIESLRGTNPPNAKAPQGSVYER
jgi:cytochrome c oxidase cbb3-type subunit III